MEISIATIIGVIILWFWLRRDKYKDYSKPNNSKDTNFNNNTLSLNRDKQQKPINENILENEKSNINTRIIKISDIPNVGDSIRDIEVKLAGKYISKEYIDYCNSLEYKTFAYSNQFQNNFNIEIHLHVSSLFNNKTKDTCLRRRLIVPLQIVPEFVELFTNLYIIQEENTWIDKQSNTIHKIKIDDYVGLGYIDSGDENFM